MIKNVSLEEIWEDVYSKVSEIEFLVFKDGTVGFEFNFDEYVGIEIPIFRKSLNHHITFKSEEQSLEILSKLERRLLDSNIEMPENVGVIFNNVEKNKVSEIPPEAIKELVNAQKAYVEEVLKVVRKEREFIEIEAGIDELTKGALTRNQIALLFNALRLQDVFKPEISNVELSQIGSLVGLNDKKIEQALGAPIVKARQKDVDVVARMLAKVIESITINK